MEVSMEVNLKSVYVAEFEKKMIDAYSIKLLINEKTTKDRICIVDESQQTAVDIENGREYHILQRDANGRLLADEVANLTYHWPYALRISPVEFDKFNHLELELMRVKARKTYERHLKKYKVDNIINLKM